MKDYSKTQEDSNNFIKYYEISSDEKYIFMYMADGSRRTIYNTKGNEEKILNQMKQQVEIAKEDLNMIKNKYKLTNEITNRIYIFLMLFAIAFTIRGVAEGMLLNAVNIISLSLAHIGLTSGLIISKLQKNKYEDLEKHIKYLENENKINESLSNELLKDNLRFKTSCKIENKPKITINNMNFLTFDEVNEIISTVEMLENYETPEKTYTLKNKK